MEAAMHLQSAPKNLVLLRVFYGFVMFCVCLQRCSTGPTLASHMHKQVPLKRSSATWLEKFFPHLPVSVSFLSLDHNWTCVNIWWIYELLYDWIYTRCIILLLASDAFVQILNAPGALCCFCLFFCWFAAVCSGRNDEQFKDDSHPFRLFVLYSFCTSC